MPSPAAVRLAPNLKPRQPGLRQVALISVAAHLPGGSEDITDVSEPVAISLSSATTLGAVTALSESLTRKFTRDCRAFAA